MKHWKQAYTLATYELKESLKAFLGIAAYLLLMFILLAFSGNEFRPYSKSDSLFFYDIVFFICFTIFPMWLQMPAFMSGQPGKNGTFAAPGVITLLQLPVLKDVISKSRIIIFLVYAFTFQIPLLVILYLTASPVRDTMDFGSYAAFAIIWLSFGMVIGGGMVISTDFSGPISTRNIICAFVYTLMVLALIYFAFNTFTGTGFVYASITAARNWPILSSILAICIAATGLHYRHHYNVKLMKKNDYL